MRRRRFAKRKLKSKRLVASNLRLRRIKKIRKLTKLMTKRQRVGFMVLNVESN